MPDKRSGLCDRRGRDHRSAGFQDYVAKASPTLAGYSARLIVRCQGAQQGRRRAGRGIVIVAFDSLEEAERWYG